MYQYFIVPDPVSVTVTSDPVSPIHPFEYPNVTLTCTVELSPAADVPVTVNTVWTGPAEFNTAQPVMGSITTYISTAMVRSFNRNKSGNYTCRATVNSESPFITNSSLSGGKRVTTGKICRLPFYSHNSCCTQRIYVGVYLSFNGTFIENDSTISINVIQTSINQPHLVCTSDRMPCCKDQPQYGEWYFPNGSQVIHRQEGAVSFHRNRDNDGNVNLFRVRDDITSPAGRFCCEIEDATHTNQTLCVNICNSTCVQITDGVATPTLGQSYVLTCSVARANFTKFQWSKDSSELNETGPTLSFHYLRLSDLGVYTCTVTVNSVLYNSSVDVNTQSEY